MKHLTKRIASVLLVLMLLMGVFAVPMGVAQAASAKNNWVTQYTNADVNGDGTIKFLIIGNSYGNNLRHMLNEYFLPKQSQKVIVAQAYIGFSGMAEYYKDNKNAEFYAEQFNTTEVTDNPGIYGSPKTGAGDGYIGGIQYTDVVKMTNWDIIMIQESPNGAAIASNFTSYLNGFVNSIKSAYSSAHGSSAKMSMAWFMTWATPSPFGSGDAYEGTNLDQFNRISTCVNDYVAASGNFDVIFPCATIIQNARTAHVDNHVVTDELKFDGMCTDNLHIVSAFSKIMAAYGLMKTLNLSTANCDTADQFTKYITNAPFNEEPGRTYRAGRMDLLMKESVDNAIKTPRTVTQSVFTGDIATTCNDGTTHEYTGAVVTAPTCTEDGYTKNTCTTCGYYHIYDVTAKLGHDYVITGEKAPSCTENGYVEQYCSRCNDNNSQTLPGGHTYGNWETVKEPTKTAEGLKRKTCSACGATMDEAIPMLTDNITYDVTFETQADFDNFSKNTVRASNSNGVYSTDEYNYFSSKDKAYLVKFVANADGTAVSNNLIAIKTPDKTYGKTFTMLTGGGYSFDTTTAAPGVIYAHDDYGYYGIKAYVAASGNVVFQHFRMSEPALKTDGYSTAAVCAETLIVNIESVDGVPVSKTTANIGDVTPITISKTNNNQQFFKYKYYVTSEGQGSVTVKVDMIYDDLISAFTATSVPMTFTVENAQKLVSSDLHTNYNSAFGFFKHSYGGQQKYTDAWGETVAHDHDSRIYSLYAEYAEKDACKHPSTKTVSAVAATCTEAGTTEAVVCTSCSETVSGGDLIPALGHDYIEKTSKAATCTEAGELKTTCSRCTYSLVTAIPALGHTVGEIVESAEPTCTTDGYKVGACSVCGATSTETTPLLGHDYGEFTVTKAATCTEKGERTKSCSRCDSVVTEVVPATGHSYGEWTVTKVPSATEAGSKSRVCSACGDTQTAEVPMDAGEMTYNLDLSKSSDFEALKSAAKMVATKNIKYATWGGEETVIDYNADAAAVALDVSKNCGTTGFVIRIPTEGGNEAQPKTFALSTGTYVPDSSLTKQIGTDTLADVIFAKNKTGYFVFSYGPTSSHLAFQPFNSDTKDSVILSGSRTALFTNLSLSAEKFYVNGVEKSIDATAYTKRFTHQGNLAKAINQLITAGLVKGTAVPTTTAEGMGTGAFYKAFTADYEVSVAANNDITINYNVHYTTDKGDVVTFKMFPITLKGNTLTFYKSADVPTTAERNLTEYLKDLSPITPVFGTSTYPVNIQAAAAYATVNSVSAEFAEPCAHAKTRTVDAKAATCTEAGNAKCVYCSDCGQLLEGAIGGGTTEPLGHSYESSVTLEPRCYADGTLQDGATTFACVRCDDSYNVAIKASHSFGDWEITTYATSTSEGEKKCTCTKCGAIITRVIPKSTTFEYNWNYAKAVEGQKDGEDTLSTLQFMDSGNGSYSSDEHHEYNQETGSFDFLMPQGRVLAGMLPTPSEYIPKSFSVKAYAEAYGQASPTPAIFVATDGNETTPTYYFFQAYLNGSASYYNIKAYTRSKSPNSNGYYSLTAKDIVKGAKLGLKTATGFNTLTNYLGERFAKYGLFRHIPLTIEYNVTTDDNGIPTVNTKLSLISTDGSGKVTTLDMAVITFNQTTLGLASDATIEPAFGIASQAGTLMDGYGEEYPELLTGEEDKCKYEFVKATYEFDVNSPNHVHSYNNGQTIAPTCTTIGGVKYICTMCGHSYMADEVPALGHDLSTVTTPPTCVKAGSSVTTCSRCNYRDVVTLPATGHAYENPVITKPATCTENGILTGTCIVCGMSGDEEIPAFGHSYGDWIVDVQATTTSKGSRHKTCETCGDVVTEEIPIVILTKDYNWDFEWANGSVHASEMLQNSTHYVSNNKNLASYGDTQTAVYNSSTKAFELYVPNNITENINGLVFDTPAGATPMTFSAEVGSEDRPGVSALYCGGVVYAADDNGFYHIALNYFGAFKHYMYYTKTDTKVTHSGDYELLKYSANTSNIKGVDGATPQFMRVYKNGELVADREANINFAALENYAKFKSLIATDLSSQLTVEVLQKARTRYDVSVENGITTIITTIIFTTDNNVYELELSAVTADNYGTLTYVNNHLTPTYSYIENGKTTAKGYKNVFGVMQYGRATGGNTTVQVYSANAKYRITGEHTHNFTVKESVNASCTKGGYTVYSCKDCSYTYEEVTGEALGHDLTVDSFEATCEKAGGTSSSCSRCDYVKEELVGNPLGHDLTTVTTEPSCESAGGMVITCSRCDYVKENLVGSALGHDYVETTVEATCGKAGAVVSTCSRCGSTNSVEIPATGNHNYVKDDAQSLAPTFANDGYNMFVCTGCGDSYKETVPATGGDDFNSELPYWDKQVIVEGDIVTLKITLRGPDRSCCGGQVDITYPAEKLQYICPELFPDGTEGYDEELGWLGIGNGSINGHTDPGLFIANFFSARGVKTDQLLCEVKFKLVSGTVSAEDFTYTEILADSVGEEVFNATPITFTCLHTVKENVSKVDPTCVASGVSVDKCSGCGEETTTVLEALGHDLNTVTTDATCSAAGSTVTSCSRCDYENVVVLPKLDHTPSDWITDKEATAEEEGSAHKECTVCGEVLETKALEKLPAGMYGDVNGDGRVNTGDTVIISKYASKLGDLPAGSEVYADVNGDGRVNTGDAVLVARYAAKIITSFPVENK